MLFAVLIALFNLVSYFSLLFMALCPPPFGETCVIVNL